MRAKRIDQLRNFFYDNGEFWQHVTHVGRQAEAVFANTEAHTHPDQAEESFDPEDAKTAWSRTGNVLNDIQGLGIYRHISFMNHSCYPNIEVSCLRSDRVQGRVSRRIEIGEAVCMSYVDEDDALTKRQKSLYVDYLFHCHCIKCRVQGADYILRRGTGASLEDESLNPLLDYLKEYAAENGMSIELVCEDIIQCSPKPEWVVRPHGASGE